MDLNHRPPGYEPGELNRCSTPQSAQRELNSRLLHGKQMGYHYTMGADLLAELSKIRAPCENRTLLSRLKAGCFAKKLYPHGQWGMRFKRIRVRISLLLFFIQWSP